MRKDHIDDINRQSKYKKINITDIDKNVDDKEHDHYQFDN